MVSVDLRFNSVFISVMKRPGNPQLWPIPQATRTRLVMLQV